MPRNKEGQLPYMDLMLGNADDFVMRHWHALSLSITLLKGLLHA